MKKVLLTGGYGFVGTNIRKGLKGYEILSPSKKELDLLSFDSVYDYIKDNCPDIIIHAAGKVGGIQDNVNNNYIYYYSNLMMGVNLIKAAELLSVSKILNFASACMYPKDFGGMICENDVLEGPLEPTNEGYALAKIAVMRMGEILSMSKPNFHFKTLIPGNLYGDYDKFDLEKSHMIPAAIMKVKKAVDDGGEVEIWGDGKVRREFMYISDLIDFVQYAVENIETIPDRVNVGLGTDYSIKEYYDAISEVVGYSGEYNYNLDRPVGMKRKLLDVSVAESLGFSPKTSLVEGIRKTYNYAVEQEGI